MKCKAPQNIEKDKNSAFDPILMKKKITQYLVLLVAFFSFYSCKKGPDDPEISLRSRKARLSGEWRLLKGNAGITSTQSGNAPFSQGFVLDGSYATASESYSGGTPIIYHFAYVLNLKIEKDGSFKLSENYGGKLLVAKGTWDFLSGAGEHKNKEYVYFQIQTIEGDKTTGHLFNKQTTNFYYKILELRNKALRIETGGSEYLNINGDNFTYNSTYEFKQ